jgi:hypothetical protein
MRDFEVAVLQLHHPDALKRAALVAAAGLLFLLALSLPGWVRDAGASAPQAAAARAR